MKYLLINSLVFSAIVITVSSTVGNSAQNNDAHAQAVDLVQIKSGNQTLDRGLPNFYDCIDDKIDNSKGAEVDDYFKEEPTKHEVKSCYEQILMNGNNSDDDSGNSQ